MRVNDRGPFAKDRIIDLSMRAADLLGFKEKGTQKVRVQYFSSANIFNKNGNVISKKNYLNQEKNINPIILKGYTHLLLGAFRMPKI